MLKEAQTHIRSFSIINVCPNIERKLLSGRGQNKCSVFKNIYYCKCNFTFSENLIFCFFVFKLQEEEKKKSCNYSFDDCRH